MMKVSALADWMGQFHFFSSADKPSKKLNIASNGSMGHGSNGSKNWIGHMAHGSIFRDPRPILSLRPTLKKKTRRRAIFKNFKMVSMATDAILKITTWVMGQELDGSYGSWVKLSDPLLALV
ncbi:hypothetical protein Btru_051183 [Bulinus truncatus]|nr:hypothetical protein Btru_051183 [Bulinus truncatus]